MSTLSWRPPYWRRGYSTTAKVYGRGSLPPPPSFLHGILKNKYSPFPRHANYGRRRGKAGYCTAWKRLGACTLRPTAVAGGTRVIAHFNTALSLIAPTYISPVELEHKRHDPPYPSYCFDTAREGATVGLRLTMWCVALVATNK